MEYPRPIIHNGLRYNWTMGCTLGGYDSVFNVYESEIGRRFIAIDSNTHSLWKYNRLINPGDGQEMVALELMLKGE